MKGPEGDTRAGMGAGYALLTVGITFALTLTGGLFLGYWLDHRLRTLPLFTVVGTLLGTGLGGFWAYQRIQGGSVRGGSGR